MSQETTPVSDGVDAGAGWHFEAARDRRTWVVCAGCTTIVLVFGALVVSKGHPVAALLALPLAFACAVIPFERKRPRVPPGLYAGDLGHGLLFPSLTMRVTSILSLLILGLTLLALPVAALVAVLRGASHPGLAFAGLLPLAFGALFLLGAYGGVRGRRRPGSGLLLTPDGVVLGAQYKPARFGWDDVTDVRAHWTASPFQARSWSMRPKGPVDNWLTFAVAPDAVVGPVPLAGLARTKEPTLKADQLAVEPEVVLAACRFYLDHPEARAELVTTAATDRVASLARTR